MRPFRPVPLTACLVVLLLSSALPPAVADEPEPAPACKAPSWDAVVESRDAGGILVAEIAVTVFCPAAAEDGPVPVVLHSHGWAGTRANTLPTAGLLRTLVDDGYGVVSFDARGHGDSTSVATIHHKDHEVRDMIALLDWIHDDPDMQWVAKEDASGVAKDIRAGATGGSYGGGYQLMLASYDDRLDAIVPEITWNDLRYSLAPNGVVKSFWVHALYWFAKSRGTDVHEDVDRWYREVMLTNEVPADAVAHFEGASPVPANIKADVLLMQSVPDVLFNLNEAVANFDALRAGQAGDVRLFTYTGGGHVLPIQPDRPWALRGASPCGDTDALKKAWFDHHLRGMPAAPVLADLATVTLALEDGGCLALDDVPRDRTTFAWAATPAPQGAGSVLLPVLSGPAVIAGIPHVSADVVSATESILTFSLVAVKDHTTRVVNDQSLSVRVQAGGTVDADLVGVATRLTAGEQLFLRIDGLNEWYATNGNRAPGPSLLTDVVLGLPVVEAP